MKAYQAANIDRASVCIVDATSEGFDLVKQGAFYLTVDLQPNKMIIDGLDALDAMSKGGDGPTAPEGVMIVDAKIVAKADLPN